MYFPNLLMPGESQWYMEVGMGAAFAAAELNSPRTGYTQPQNFENGSCW